MTDQTMIVTFSPAQEAATRRVVETNARLLACKTLIAAADRLESLDKAATPGPWRVLESHGRDITDEGWSYYGIYAGSGPRPREIAEMRWDDISMFSDGDAKPREDADLIVALRPLAGMLAGMLRQEAGCVTTAGATPNLVTLAEAVLAAAAVSE